MTKDFTTDGLLYPLTKGDVQGHVFHGNQYRTGEGGGIVPVKPTDIKKAIINGYKALYGNRKPMFSTTYQGAIRGLKNKTAGLTIKPRDTHWNDRNREVAKPDSRYVLGYVHSDHYGKEAGQAEFSQMLDALEHQGFAIDPQSIDLDKCQATVLGRNA